METMIVLASRGGVDGRLDLWHCPSCRYKTPRVLLYRERYLKTWLGWVEGVGKVVSFLPTTEGHLASIGARRDGKLKVVMWRDD